MYIRAIQNIVGKMSLQVIDSIRSISDLNSNSRDMNMSTETPRNMYMSNETPKILSASSSQYTIDQLKNIIHEKDKEIAYWKNKTKMLEKLQKGDEDFLDGLEGRPVSNSIQNSTHFLVNSTEQPQEKVEIPTVI